MGEDSGFVAIEVWGRFTDEHARRYVDLLFPKVKLVVNNSEPNEAYRLYERTGDERLRTVM